ncbi:MAG: ABC transporter permease subunit [Phycisphaerales bacterium]
MTTYILRRLLLMIPTLIGITFLVFMLIALSPGGVGASLRVAGGQMEASSRALQEAYLEERYGLDDPPVVQYLRWLGRISPIKFGSREQIDPTGEFIRPPKMLDPPMLAGSWYAVDEPIPQPPGVEPYEFRTTEVLTPADLAPGAVLDAWLVDAGTPVIAGQEIAEIRIGSPEPEGGDADPRYLRIVADMGGVFSPVAGDGAALAASQPIATIAEDRTTVYRRGAQDWAMARGTFVQARTELKEALQVYADVADLPGAFDRKGNARESVFERHTPAAETPEQQEALARVREAGEAALGEYELALQERARLESVFIAKPFREAGFWIIPGLVSVAPPDFGVSFSRNRPVMELVGDALPITLMLNSVAFPIIYIIAIPLGMLAASRAGTFLDVGIGAGLVALWSVPVVWAGVLAVGYLANDRYLGWFPVAGLHSAESGTMLFLPGRDADGVFQRGYLLDTLWHMALPVACLVYGGFAVLSKQTRAAMLDNFNADYVRTAKAKGVMDRDIVFRHVFRNSLLPLITMFASIFPAMLAGSVVIERIFSIPGMGSLVIDAIYLRDRELLLATTMMIGATNLLALLIADILYAIADPRISYN